jgi:hypothetical protein
MNKKLSLFFLLSLLFLSGCSTKQVIYNNIITTDYAHHEIHEGKSFFIDDKVTLANGTTRDILLITPDCNTDRFDNMLFKISSSTIITTSAIYEGSTYSALGTPEPIHNRNRFLNNASLSLAYTNPTITTLGLRLLDEHWGSVQKGGGEVRGSSEIILNCSTNYLFRVTSGAAGNLINIDIGFYEDALNE